MTAVVDLEALEFIAGKIEHLGAGPSLGDHSIVRNAVSELRLLRGLVNESLSDDEKEIALAQACEFAGYVERQAKGAMVDAARKFLSLPYAQTLAAELTRLRAIEARVEGAEKDAARYRWLREHVDWEPMPVDTCGAVYLVATMVSPVYGDVNDQTDEAIDRLMAAESGERES